MSPNGQQTQYRTSTFGYNITVSIYLPFNQWSLSGVYSIVSFSLEGEHIIHNVQDQNGNTNTYNATQLEKIGAFTNFTINGTTPDTIPPQLVSFSFEPREFYTVTEQFNCTLSVTDNVSGFFNGWIAFVSNWDGIFPCIRKCQH